MRIPVQYLGQSGWKIEFPGGTIYVDPYLSNSVEELDSPDLKRLQPIRLFPEAVTDADYVLITHNHMDHCDPHTIPIISKYSPHSRFIGPKPVIEQLSKWGISQSRLVIAPETWLDLENLSIKIHAVPAAHLDVERDSNGNLSCLGFLLEFQGKRIYIAGDTCLTPEVVNAVQAFKPIHIAVLPVNEHNYYRAKRGIVGNMSVREAFQFAIEIQAKNVVAVHWDMFEINSVFPEEIRLIHSLLNPGFSLSLDPSCFNLSDIDLSIVIRTLNEAKHLGKLLDAIKQQNTQGLTLEVVIVDSGSTDQTLEIAKAYGCHIEYIHKSNFSFGRSLNLGCTVAAGEILVITSGHCVPVDENWLIRLCEPILKGSVQYTYGRQYGGESTYFSEHRIFAKYFPEQSQIPQEGFFCNNANSAIHRQVWMSHRFDEELTGLEDMELARRVIDSGAGKIAYIAEAGVYHYHEETWSQVRRRFEREAIALQKIMPQVQLSIWDALRYFFSSCYKDWRAKSNSTDIGKNSLIEILLYRWNQYIGSWSGNHEHRKLSLADKEKYFYPQ